MQPPESSEAAGGGGGGGGGRGRKAVWIMTRCGCSVLISLGASFLLSFVLGLVAIAMGSLSASNSVTVPALCRIVSSSVDIKSSKVCELGFLNYKAKHVFYPKERSRFRCHDDYYWASVFEVEYKEYFSGQILHAVAQAPKEALPHECRPSFDTAWITKMKFKVNKTYNCRYMLGSHKADIHPDSLFNCQAKDPSTSEMIRRSFILFTRSVSEKGTSGWQMGYTVAGIVLGMLTAMCCTIFLKLLQAVVLSLGRQWHEKMLLMPISALRLRRACLLVAYFSAVAWLLLQYPKIIGLKQLSFNSNLREQIM